LWDITRVPKLRPLLTHVSGGHRRVQVESVLDRFEARVAPALPGLSAQVIHGDMSLDNVLFSEDLRVSGIGRRLAVACRARFSLLVSGPRCR
jgi:Ser/Thr protein kinase RdoA (MazF antagonist)